PCRSELARESCKDNAGYLIERGVLECFASKLAPTTVCLLYNSTTLNFLL
ncbi:outer membrane lipoprotein carrier protein LolA, partial [Pseudomonas lactis]